MVYPSAPWTLYGRALQTLQLVEIEQARPLIPPELQIISVWPGKTIGGVYLASYGPGSVLEYNELIVVPALVNYSGKIGFWISHIYVDNPDSVAGGREIWGLPKELAEFDWKQGKQGQIVVRQSARQLCSFYYAQQTWGWRQQFTVPSFSALGTDLLSFQGRVKSRVGLTSARLKVPVESPFAGLIGQPWLTISCQALTMTAHAPERVGQCDRPRSSVKVSR